MAPVNTSSRRKSSSSQKKKKRSKPSSEAGRRSRNRSRSRKKNKSKKLRRDASISYSEDDSRTVDSISVSSSDSDDDYRSRRARSRTRGDAKGSRKRARRSSPSPDTDRGSPSRRKRKASKKIRGSKERRKSKYRKNNGSLRYRRDANVSPTSSGSLSCSTCRESGTDHERTRVRSEERDKSKRSPFQMNNGRYNSRHGLGSSSCSTCDERSSHQSEESYKGEKHSQRLRSVVLTVAQQSEEKEGSRNSRDDDRTEILQAYDDCPSCRSNDSYDGGRKREPSYHPHGASDKKRRVDDAKGEDTSKIRATEIIGIGKENDRAKYDGNDQNLSMVGPTRTSSGSRSELPSAIGSSEGDDLELKLREKALENLRKFRGLHANTNALQKDENGGDGNLPSTAKIETVQNKAQKEDKSQLLGATQVVSQNVTPLMERKSTFSTPKGGLIHDQKHESMVKPDDVHPIKGVGKMVLNQTPVTGKLTEKNQPNVGINGNSRQESSVDQSNLKEAPTSKEFTKEKLLEARNISNRSVIKSRKTSPGSSNTHVAASNEARLAAPEASTILTTATTEHCRTEQQDEAKGSSQFEQKTMSVMRGGEMVQVSYKVYIPKKAPALARRQLQR